MGKDDRGQRSEVRSQRSEDTRLRQGYGVARRAEDRRQLAAALFGRSVAMSCLDDFYAFYDFYGFNDLQLTTVSDRDEKCLLN